MLFVILLIVFLIGLGIFMGFAAKKDKQNPGTGLSDPNAGTQRGPQ